MVNPRLTANSICKRPYKASSKRNSITSNSTMKYPIPCLVIRQPMHLVLSRQGFRLVLPGIRILVIVSTQFPKTSHIGGQPPLEETTSSTAVILTGRRRRPQWTPSTAVLTAPLEGSKSLEDLVNSFVLILAIDRHPIRDSNRNEAATGLTSSSVAQPEGAKQDVRPSSAVRHLMEVFLVPGGSSPKK